LISYGDQKQLVYYWFQQRGRVMTNEFVVKWNMLVDAITRNRSDGALVRLVIPLSAGGDVEKLDKALTDFAGRLAPVMSDYIPN
jgi:EpsI family protein